MAAEENIMAQATITNIERRLKDEDIIVSKTDTKGLLTYCNQTFMTISDYRESELLGKPHNVIRHPKMPRCIFKLLWDTISSGHELFAYVVNRTKGGDHYWVFSHITPDFDETGKLLGYHSFRRSVRRESLAVIEPLYAQLLAEEAKYPDRKEGMAASSALLASILSDKEMTYEQFVFSL